MLNSHQIEPNPFVHRVPGAAKLAMNRSHQPIFPFTSGRNTHGAARQIAREYAQIGAVVNVAGESSEVMVSMLSELEGRRASFPRAAKGGTPCLSAVVGGRTGTTPTAGNSAA
jgi:hypothetical protein